MVGGESETRGRDVAPASNPRAALEHPEQMRDWQKSLAAETVPSSSDSPVPDPKAASWSPQLIWSAVTAVLVFVILVTVRPPIVESLDREKPLEPRRLNWPLVLVSSLSAGAATLLLSTL